MLRVSEWPFCHTLSSRKFLAGVVSDMVASFKGSDPTPAFWLLYSRFWILSSGFYLLYSIPVMPIGTALHERTLPLCTSLNYRDWAGYYAVSAYETHHEHENNAIRNGAAL